jgi:[protein-PII] uridylyltransferase
VVDVSLAPGGTQTHKPKDFNPKWCREWLQKKNAALDKQFSPRCAIRKLLNERSKHLDELLQMIWRHHTRGQENGLVLISTGGYGREELHPYSDIDLLILTKDGSTGHFQGIISKFIAFLWGLKLQISHSARNLDECITWAKQDLSVFTSLMESRCIAGNHNIYDSLMRRMDKDQLWPSQKFCAARIQKQKERNSRYSNISFNLEPDIKNSPGGLRELQTLLWIARRHFGAKSISQLAKHKFLTSHEARMLSFARDFLWRIRYAMHMHSERCQDRLDFHLQRRLAEFFSDASPDEKQLIEAFMKTYYRWVSKIRLISNLLIRHFEEQILLACKSERTRKLNARFRLRNQYIEAKNTNVFIENPGALLEIFMLMAQDSNIKGIRVETLRLIYKRRLSIGASYRSDPKNAGYFMGILRSGERVGEVLELMRRYEILGRWLPEFARLHGQIQHDLFHVYTVDVHLVTVTRNINGLIYPGSDFTLVAPASKDGPKQVSANLEMRSDFALPTQVARRTPKSELLYIAALYHDIAKGRGGDHSILGVDDVRKFAKRHGLHENDSELLQFLVRHHLLMSVTAQKKDCNDPEVLMKFSSIVGNIERLNHLYVLTVADICGTNPKLWDGWRASLLHQLYLNARQWMLRGAQEYTGRMEHLHSIKNQGISLLKAQKLPIAKVKALWSHYDDEYFIREKLDDIVWHTRSIIRHNDPKPLVMARKSGEFKFRPATQIFVYWKQRGNILSILSNALERAEASIQYAHIMDTTDQHVLSSFFVMPSEQSASVQAQTYQETLVRLIEKTLSAPNAKLKAVRHLDTPKLKAFTVPLQVSLNYTRNAPHNTLEITTVDRFGLLSCLMQSLSRLNLQLRGARITTLGERVDDVLYITDERGKVVQENAERELLEQKLREDLESWINTGEIADAQS